MPPLATSLVPSVLTLTLRVLWFPVIGRCARHLRAIGPLHVKPGAGTVMFCRRFCNAPKARGDGFTLIELLVVMLIILLVSAVVLRTVIPAISHRQVSEAARILQGALAGARDTAIK